MAEPKTLWEPSQETVDKANITAFARWLEGEGVGTRGYEELRTWSVEHIERFWESFSSFSGVRWTAPYSTPLERRAMPGAKWFPGGRLNYAEHVFARRDPGGIAMIATTESDPLRVVSWSELEKKTAAFAESLRGMGVGRGDRVAAYLPNVPEAVIALLACASIGAVWSSCAPDFGALSAVERFRQIEPKVLIGTYGYDYRGNWNPRADVVSHLRESVPSVEHTVMVGRELGATDRLDHWDDLTRSGPKLTFEQVEFDHPIWIVFSSGTTGPPKAMVHGHGGILLEHLKALSLHNDLKVGDRMFWYTSTGWMMWNYLVSSLLLGSTVVLYEGDPLYPSASALWDLADETGMTFLGASAAYLRALAKSGAEPVSTHSLKRLRGIGSTGSALTVDSFDWVYSHAKKDVWLASISGGTDLVTAFVGGCPTLPVREGRIQCRYLGADIAAYDEEGRPVVGRMGELVLRQPMPSMPLYLWGDAGGERYRESYFGVFDGVWRHGDWIQIDEDGSCVIFGRSDATIKRMGIRMGTSEIYRVVESIPWVEDSLVVDMEFLGGRSYMPLFLVPRGGEVVDEERESEVKRRIRTDISPRFVPDEIVVVQEVPRTLNGKKVEVPVRRILLGAEPSTVYNPGSLKNPGAMEFFVSFARKMRE